MSYERDGDELRIIKQGSHEEDMTVTASLAQDKDDSQKDKDVGSGQELEDKGFRLESGYGQMTRQHQVYTVSQDSDLVHNREHSFFL